MATITKYPQSYGTGWTNPVRALSDDGSYATLAFPKSSYTYNYYYNFDFQVPTGATINSITIESQYKLSTTSSTATYVMACTQGTTVKGTQYSDTSEPTSDTVRTTTNCGTWTVADLNSNLSSGFNIRIGGTRGSSNTAVTGSVDYVKATIDYTLNADVTSVVAGATADANAPAVSATRFTAVESVLASATASAAAPTVTAVDPINASVVTVTAEAIAEAIAPSVSIAATVTTVTANATAAGVAPSVTATQSVSATTVTASATAAEALSPSVTTTRSADVVSVTAEATANATAPTVTTTRNATVVTVPAMATAYANICYFSFARRFAFSSALRSNALSSESRNAFVGSVGRNRKTFDKEGADGGLDLRRGHGGN